MLRLEERRPGSAVLRMALPGNGECASLAVVENGREIAATITGIDRRAVRLSGTQRGYFARFHSDDRPDAAAMLLQHMRDWQAKRGMREVFGPVALDGSGFRIGVKASGFDLGPELLNPNDPPHCDALIRAAGGTVETKWRSFELDFGALRQKRYPEAQDWASARHGVSVRALDPLRKKCDLVDLHAAMELDGRIDHQEFANQLALLSPVLDRRLVLAAYREGAPAGMLMVLRDKRSGDVRVATVHALERSRRSPVPIALMGALVRALEQLPPTRLTASVIDETNSPSIALIEGAGGHAGASYHQYTFLC